MHKISSLVILLVLATTPVYATVIPNLSGVITEGNNVLLPPGTTPDFTFSDFSGVASDNTLQIVSDASIFGRINRCCVDAFVLDLAGNTADLVIGTTGGPSGFLVDMMISDTNTNLNLSITLNHLSGPIVLNNRTGQVVIIFSGNKKRAYWEVDVNNVQPVVAMSEPGHLILSGLLSLFGFTAWKRKKN